MADGNDFKQLDFLAIQLLSNATIGIINSDKGICTGVSIGSNTLLTAKHCTEKTKINDKITLSIPNNISPTEAIVKQVIRPSEEWGKFLHGEDVAIIKLTKNIFTNFVPQENIISSSLTGTKGVVSLLANKIWNGDNNLYVMGWGTQQFKFKTIPVYNKNINNINFPSLSRVCGSDYNFQPDPDSYYYWGGNPNNKTAVRNVVELGADAVCPNKILWDLPLATIQPGDSGGPVYSCQSKTNCFLIGIVKGLDLTKGAATTLATPYFDKISSSLDLKEDGIKPLARGSPNQKSKLHLFARSD